MDPNFQNIANWSVAQREKLARGVIEATLNYAPYNSTDGMVDGTLLYICIQSVAHVICSHGLGRQ